MSQLPADFPGTIFIVHHMPADASGAALLRALDKQSALTCTEARDGAKFEAGRVYVAPSDHHLMIKAGKLLITKGARETAARPAIDPLFRSAAVAYGNRVIGVVLTGYLDDGAAGLAAIKRCGGVCVVQDPSDAAYPDMPQNALEQVKVDHCVPLAEMGALLTRLVEKEIGAKVAAPDDIVIEARIAERVLDDMPSVESVEPRSGQLPGCGGVLWEVDRGDSLRYRCHTGHSYTAPILLALQTEKIEETLWIALRMFEERRNMLERMSAYSPKRRPGARVGVAGAGNREIYSSTAERARNGDPHRADPGPPPDGRSRIWTRKIGVPSAR